MVVVVTIGFVNDVHYVDDSGFNVYHKNRLIKLGFVMINNDKHNYVLCEAYLLSFLSQIRSSKLEFSGPMLFRSNELRF